MPDFFFDTSVLVAYFKREDMQSREWIVQVLNGQASAAVSAITVAEVWSASDMADDIARRERQATLDLLDVIPINRVIPIRGGELRREHNLALPDALIAACAEQSGGQFLSKDPHFNRLLEANVLSGQVY